MYPVEPAFFQPQFFVVCLAGEQIIHGYMEEVGQFIKVFCGRKGQAPLPLGDGAVTDVQLVAQLCLRETSFGAEFT